MMTNYSGLDLVKQEQCKLTYATFLSDVVDCYDKTKNSLILNNPFFFETTYDPISKTLSNSGFSLRRVELLSNEKAIRPVLSLDNNTTGLELILKAGKYSKKQIIPYSHLSLCNSTNCYDLPYDLFFCESFVYNDIELQKCFNSSMEAPITDEAYVITNCPTGEICTEFGCLPKHTQGSPCDQSCSALSLFEAPIIENYYQNDLTTSIGSIDKFYIDSSGNIEGTFKTSNLEGSTRRMTLKILNIYDYIVQNVYTDGVVTKTVDIMYFIATKYLGYTENNAVSFGREEIDVGILLGILPTLSSTIFDWSRLVNMPIAQGYRHSAPCKYVVVTVDISRNDIITRYYYQMANNYIGNIYKTGFDVIGLQSLYDEYSNKVKWLISEDAYVYAVYQEYLSPDIPIEY